MSLDDVRHVEACALLRRIIDDPNVGPLIPFRAAVEGWLEENHPPTDAYTVAMHDLAERYPPMASDLHDELVPRGLK